MGVASSVGIDIDPQAVTSALQNMALNEISSNRMSVHLVPNNVNSLPADETTSDDQASYSLEFGNEKGKFDIVIANILLNPLVELADHILGFGKTGAVIGLSGILSEQVRPEHYLIIAMHASHLSPSCCLLLVNLPRSWIITNISKAVYSKCLLEIIIPFVSCSRLILTGFEYISVSLLDAGATSERTLFRVFT